MTPAINAAIEAARDPVLVSRTFLADSIHRYGWEFAWWFFKERQRIRVKGKWARRNRKRYGAATLAV